MTLLTMEVSLGRMKSFSRKLCLRVICKFMPKGLWHQSIFTLDAGIEKKKKISKGTQEEIFSFLHASNQSLLGSK